MLLPEPNIQAGKDYYAAIQKAFEAKNPGVKIQIEYMDDTSFKAKLPTLLQSNARPDLFFTWTGGVFFEQAKTGILKAVSYTHLDVYKRQLQWRAATSVPGEQNARCRVSKRHRWRRDDRG